MSQPVILFVGGHASPVPMQCLLQVDRNYFKIGGKAPAELYVGHIQKDDITAPAFISNH